MTQDLQFSARAVDNIAPASNHAIRVDVEEADTDDILDQIGLDEIYDHFGDDMTEFIKEKLGEEDKNNERIGS